MTLTLKQWLAIAAAILSAMAVATTQMVDIFGPTLAKSIMGAAGLVSTLLNTILAIITSQTGTVRDVQSMPGVEKITVNKEASSALATMAVDPVNQKIEATPSAQAAVSNTAANA
jgi:hypothetical protein